MTDMGVHVVPYHNTHYVSFRFTPPNSGYSPALSLMAQRLTPRGVSRAARRRELLLAGLHRVRLSLKRPAGKKLSLAYGVKINQFNIVKGLGL